VHKQKNSGTWKISSRLCVNFRLSAKKGKKLATADSLPPFLPSFLPSFFPSFLPFFYLPSFIITGTQNQWFPVFFPKALLDNTANTITQ